MCSLALSSSRWRLPLKISKLRIAWRIQRISASAYKALLWDD